MQTPSDASAHPSAVENARYALEYLKDNTKSSDAQLARVLGCSRPAVINRRQGETPLTLNDISALAAAFKVPVTVFLMDPEDLRRWLVENFSEWGSTMLPKKYKATSQSEDALIGQPIAA